ncbi:MAG: COG3014 family protein [Candidatus Omnitrophota bacterium]
MRHPFRFFHPLIFIAVAFCTAGCASVIPAVQSRVRRLAAEGDYSRALKLMNTEGVDYGPRNHLLYLLDLGVLSHYGGSYRRSIAVFEEAKRRYDELYTRSISRGVSTWLWNDYNEPYRPEDFERAWINIFQALNFTALGEFNEALVEARDVQDILNRINARYPADQQNHYRDDAFVRLLMGMLYEQTGSHWDRNDAYVSYRLAWNIYQDLFGPLYEVDAPDVVKENLLITVRRIDPAEYRRLRTLFVDTAQKIPAHPRQYARVYLIHMSGQLVNKVQGSLFLPGTDDYLVRIAFPKYRRSFRPDHEVTFRAVSQSGTTYENQSELAVDLDAIARQNLENRRLRIVSAAVARPLAKQLVFEAVGDRVNDSWGDGAGDAVRYAGSAYIAYSERADTRSWETLPARVSVARLWLPPGKYILKSGDDVLTTEPVVLNAGNIRIFWDWSAM